MPRGGTVGYGVEAVAWGRIGGVGIAGGDAGVAGQDIGRTAAEVPFGENVGAEVALASILRARHAY